MISKRKTIAWKKVMNFVKFVDGLSDPTIKEALACKILSTIHEKTAVAGKIVDIPSMLLPNWSCPKNN